MTKNKQILGYLSGPIDNCSDVEINDWRKYIIDNYPGYSWYDPTKLTSKYSDFDDIIREEKKMIETCDFMLVYPWKPSSGTAMELMYAYMLLKPIILIKLLDDYVSPWMMYHSDYIAPSFKDGMEYIENIFKEN
jgi:nucleoside 2-deoxyribosyltransferase